MEDKGQLTVQQLFKPGNLRRGSAPVEAEQRWCALGCWRSRSIASLTCQDDSVPVPKNNATSGFPQCKQKEQLMCKYAVLKEKNRAVFLLITQSYF